MLEAVRKRVEISNAEGNNNWRNVFRMCMKWWQPINEKTTKAQMLGENVDAFALANWPKL